MSDRQAELRRWRDEFTTLIDEQAAALLERWSEPRLAALGEALAAFGVSEPPAVRYLGMWEDMEHGLLPPAVRGELALRAGEQRLVVEFQAPVGAFHDPAKPEQIFELCMLRAEAEQELRGEGDGHVLQRMAELREMIAAGRVVYDQD